MRFVTEGSVIVARRYDRLLWDHVERQLVGRLVVPAASLGGLNESKLKGARKDAGKPAEKPKVTLKRADAVKDKIFMADSKVYKV